MKTLLKQSKLSEKLFLDEDSNIINDNDENVVKSKNLNEYYVEGTLQYDIEIDELPYSISFNDLLRSYRVEDDIKDEFINLDKDIKVDFIDINSDGSFELGVTTSLSKEEVKNKLNKLLVETTYHWSHQKDVDEFDEADFTAYVEVENCTVDDYIYESLKENKKSLKEDIKEDENMENIPEKGTYIAYGHAGIEAIKDAKENDYYIEVTKYNNAGDTRYEIWVDPSRRYNGSPRNITEAVEDDELLELEEPEDEEPIEDEPVDNIEEPVEPVTQEVADNAYTTQINDLINNEYEKIDNVKSIIATFDNEDAIDKNEEVISILNSYIDESTILIGMLTQASNLIDSTQSDLMNQGIKLAKDAIKTGKEKAKEEKEETEE